MNRPEYWLRRLTVIFVCAAVIMLAIYVMARVFAYFAPAP